MAASKLTAGADTEALHPGFFDSDQLFRNSRKIPRAQQHFLHKYSFYQPSNSFSKCSGFPFFIPATFAEIQAQTGVRAQASFQLMPKPPSIAIATSPKDVQ